MKLDSTISFFKKGKPDSIEHLLPIKATSPNIRSLSAPGWVYDENTSSWFDFCKFVLNHRNEKSIFFIDTSFLYRQEIPTEVFDALLSRGIAFTPQIWRELEDWRNNPFANLPFRDAVLKSLGAAEPHVRLLGMSDFPENVQQTISYYTALLTARKHLGVEVQRSKSTNGRTATEIELTPVLQKLVGDRGALLARKGLKDHAKPNFSADEELVVMAVAHSILTGERTVILTRDRDPMEQFRKFNYLLDTDYRSRLIGESYIESPENLIINPLPEDKTTNQLQIHDLTVLDLGRRLVDWVLPQEPTPVTNSCVRLAGPDDRMKMAHLHFKAHREMRDIMEHKGRSGGRNVELPDGRNCHIALSPPFNEKLTGTVLLCHEVPQRYGPFFGPLVDLQYALLEMQRFRRKDLKEDILEIPGGTPGMKLADFFITERFAFSDADWKTLEWTELTTALQFYDNAAFTYIDRDVVPHLPERVLEILLTRRPSWTTSIRDEALKQEWVAPKVGPQFVKVAAVDIGDISGNDHGFGYYTTLLSVRKQFGNIIEQRVLKDHGRPCRKGEISEIARHYGGDRAQRLAELQGYKDDPLFFSSEELLVYGILNAILEGTDAVFITRDPVFMDQFAQLCALIRNDYHAHQFAIKDPVQLRKIDFGAKEDVAEDEVMGECVVCKLHSGWENAVLPSNPYLLNFHCWLLGKEEDAAVRFSAITFCGERGMHSLLRVKGATGGKNADDIGDKNIRCGMTISLWKDRMITCGTVDFPDDYRLTHKVPSLAAADISQVIMNDPCMILPWHEEANAVS